MAASTAPQRRFIETLAAGLTDEEFVREVRATGHTGSAVEAPGIFTRNQILKRISKAQASSLIEALKELPRHPAPRPKPDHFLNVTEPEPLAPVEVEVPKELTNAAHR